MELTSQQEEQTLEKSQTVLRQSSEELSILHNQKPVLLKNQATEFERFIDVAETQMARNWRGFGNQSMSGVLEKNE